MMGINIEGMGVTFLRLKGDRDGRRRFLRRDAEKIDGFRVGDGNDDDPDDCWDWSCPPKSTPA